MQESIRHAEQLLEKAEVVTLAVNGEDGCPRAYVMTKLPGESIRVFRSWPRRARKRSGLWRRTPGLCQLFCAGGSVSLTGTVQLIRESGALRELWVPELDRIFPMGPESGELVLLRFESRQPPSVLWEKWRSSRCKKTASALRKSRILWTENQKTACRAISRSRWILPHRSSNSSIRSGPHLRAFLAGKQVPCFA